MEEEIWRDIEGYEGKYQVSNLGNVRSLNYNHTKNTKNLKQSETNDGYLRVKLWKNHIPTNCFVHRLVVKAFPEICGKLADELQVDHINTITNDNRAINLRVCTAKENFNNPLTKKHYQDSMVDEEFRKMQSINQSKLWENEEYKKEHLKNLNDGRIIRWSKEGSRERQSETAKRLWQDKDYKEKHSTAQSENWKNETYRKSVIEKMSKPVIQYNKNSNIVIKEWASATEVERNIGIKASTITACCMKKPHRNTAGGYKWSYK